VGVEVWEGRLDGVDEAGQAGEQLRLLGLHRAEARDQEQEVDLALAARRLELLSAPLVDEVEEVDSPPVLGEDTEVIPGPLDEEPSAGSPPQATARATMGARRRMALILARPRREVSPVPRR
jgi:hypothetical protein